MSYRDDVTALGHKVEALAREVRERQGELADAERALGEARRRDRLPVLDGLRVAAPCRADWAEMTGDERVRHCGKCDKAVYNLSGMTRAAAEALLIEKEGKLCVRYYKRADGTVLTADCPDGVQRRRRRVRIVAAGLGAMTALGALAASLHRPTMGAPMQGALAPAVKAPRVPMPAPATPPPDVEVMMGEPAQVTR